MRVKLKKFSGMGPCIMICVVLYCVYAFFAAYFHNYSTLFTRGGSLLPYIVLAMCAHGDESYQ